MIKQTNSINPGWHWFVIFLSSNRRKITTALCLRSQKSRKFQQSLHESVILFLRLSVFSRHLHYISISCFWLILIELSTVTHLGEQFLTGSSVKDKAYFLGNRGFSLKLQIISQELTTITNLISDARNSRTPPTFLSPVYPHSHIQM